MSINSDNRDVALGNTKPKPKQESDAKMWCFTINNYTEEELNKLVQSLNSDDKYVIGKEVGKEGTPHLQGYIKFYRKCRLTALKKLNERAHWEKCKGNEKDNVKYCTKDGKYVTNMEISKPLKLIKDEQLYVWQKEIVAMVKEEPDDRSIYWYWEPNGRIGKTQFSKYLSAKYKAIPIEGKKSDILYCAAMFESEIYIMDIERSAEDYVSYAAIEKIKNGYYMCAKYESRPVIRNSPHLIVFANFEPDLDKLSLDRWHVKELSIEKDCIVLSI